MGAPLSECYQFPELASKMPGHDHSLQKLYTIEGLSNPSMVYNWICPVMLKEVCPYEALAHIFNCLQRSLSLSAAKILARAAAITSASWAGMPENIS